MAGSVARPSVRPGLVWPRSTRFSAAHWESAPQLCLCGSSPGVGLPGSGSAPHFLPGPAPSKAEVPLLPVWTQSFQLQVLRVWPPGSWFRPMSASGVWLYLHIASWAVAPSLNSSSRAWLLPRPSPLPRLCTLPQICFLGYGFSPFRPSSPAPPLSRLLSASAPFPRLRSALAPLP